MEEKWLEGYLIKNLKTNKLGVVINHRVYLNQVYVKTENKKRLWSCNSCKRINNEKSNNSRK